MKKLTYENIAHAKELNVYLEQGNRVLDALGYTDHSQKHTAKVAVTAGKILKKLGYDAHTVELVRIAGYMHDLGNSINRVNYAALSSKLHVDTHKKVITLNIELDESICSMIDYFEIFSQRMLMCKRAAEVLGLRFKLVANGNKIA